MKKPENRIQSPGRLLLSLALLFLGSVLCSCTRDLYEEDNSTIAKPGGGLLLGSSNTQNKFLFGYDNNGVAVRYKTRYIDSQLGSEIAVGNENTLGSWDKMAAIQSGNRQFVFGHNEYFDLGLGSKWFEIREVLSYGEVGAITDEGEWGNSYETVFGFRVGEKGFLFGQDSYGDHRWFVQEITSQGKLAASESDHGNWNNYYQSATPIYVNGKTFLFFQTSSSDNYWFIVYVSDDGLLYDVCDGYWGYFWDVVTSVESGGKTYLIGHESPWRYDTGSLDGHVAWFIQQINSDGTMGPETDHGFWNSYYHVLRGYTSGGNAFIFGHCGDYGLWFIQGITADGKMGTETAHGTMDSGYDFFYPYNLNDPGGFRYSIGWDLSKTTGAPTRSWSSLFTDPWLGETKFGGGAALADIDGDVNKRVDAVLVGIQKKAGVDRFYYKVAWNLDGTGTASYWSQTIYGPDCGEIQAGGGADIADIDGNGVPDLLLMSVDYPEGINSFRYNIGWNMGTSGKVASWSGMIQGPSIGLYNSGGGAALGDIDKNGRPDVVFMGIDNPDQGNSYRYVIGKNLDKSGKAESWTPWIDAPCRLGWSSAGGGAALADVNGNGKPDLVLMNIDNPQGANPFWCHVGWDIDINGSVTGWSSFTGPSLGSMTSGGGAAIADIDKNGIPDLLLMTIDDPYGAD